MEARATHLQQQNTKIKHDSLWVSFLILQSDYLSGYVYSDIFTITIRHLSIFSRYRIHISHLETNTKSDTMKKTTSL